MEAEQLLPSRVSAKDSRLTRHSSDVLRQHGTIDLSPELFGQRRSGTRAAKPDITSFVSH